ncbi:uncharacterized protein LOC135473619 [Liolophura sinensis]|uniref:uncharacterized protein LOC135473619 n=1 Tax=Liolophura sinensis TaxID=3198878 RepID=UPI003158338A
MAHLWVLLISTAAAVTPTLQGDIDTQILRLYQGNFNGDATYYGEGSNRGGLCQYFPPGLPPAGRAPGMRSAALNSRQIYNSMGCGMCFKVHGTGDGLGQTPVVGDSYAFVDDVCPECHEGDLDFSEDGDGRWDIGIQAVQCPVGDSNIEYKFQGSHQWYIKLQIRNHRIPITHLELFQKKMKTFLPLKHTLDGFWELDDNQIWEKPLEVPLTIRLTAANGEVLEDSVDAIKNDVVIQGSVQVSLDPSLPSMKETSNPGPTSTGKPGGSLKPNSSTKSITTNKPTIAPSSTAAKSPTTDKPTTNKPTTNKPTNKPATTTKRRNADSPTATPALTTTSPGTSKARGLSSSGF